MPNIIKSRFLHLKCAISSIIILLNLLLSFPANARKLEKEMIDSMLLQLPKSKEDTAKVKTLNAIAYKYNSINPEEGKKYAKLGLELSDKLGWKKGVERAYITIASNYESQSNFSLAMEFYKKSLEICESEGFKEDIGVNKEYIGNILLAKGDYPGALKLYLEVLEINKEISDYYNIARNFSNIALIYQALGDFKQAFFYSRKSLSIHEKYQDKNAVATSCINLAISYNGQKLYDSALIFSQKALEIFREKGDNYAIANVLCNMGEFNKNLLQYKNALDNFSEAFKIAEDGGYKLIGVNTLGNIGETYLLIAKDVTSKIPTDLLIPQNKSACLNKAIDYLKRAINGCKEINDNGGVLEFSKYLSDAFQLSGNFTAALDNYKVYSNSKDSLFGIEKIKEIANLENNLVFDTKNKRLDYVYNSISKERNRVLFLIAGLSVLSFIIAFLIKGHINQRKTNELLLKELQNIKNNNS